MAFPIHFYDCQPATHPFFSRRSKLDERTEKRVYMTRNERIWLLNFSRVTALGAIWYIMHFGDRLNSQTSLKFDLLLFFFKKTPPTFTQKYLRIHISEFLNRRFSMVHSWTILKSRPCSKSYRNQSTSKNVSIFLFSNFFAMQKNIINLYGKQ